MAKQPKKKPTTPAKPASPKKPAKPAKPAPKPAAKPKVTVKSKPAAKTKPVAKPSAKQPKKKPAVKPTTVAKSKPAAKKKPAVPKKPAKKTGGVSLTGTEAAGVYDTSTSLVSARVGGGGAPATPQIGSPLASAAVPAGMNLTVNVSTNRSDLAYIIELTDITPPARNPVPVQFPVPAPAGNPFSKTIPGANLLPGRTYRIRVFVDPASGATPPNGDHTINVTT